MVLSLVFYGAEVLRQRAQEVCTIDDKLGELARQMTDTMLAEGGIGIAANQVGVLQRVFVMRRYLMEGGQLVWSESQVCINPVVIEASTTCVSQKEGTMSIPGISAEVRRPVSIVLSWTDLDGTTQEERLYDLQARIALHEIDHLDGVLFIDRISPKKRRAIEPLLQKMLKE